MSSDTNNMAAVQAVANLNLISFLGYITGDLRFAQYHDNIFAAVSSDGTYIIIGSRVPELVLAKAYPNEHGGFDIIMED